MHSNLTLPIFSNSHIPIYISLFPLPLFCKIKIFRSYNHAYKVKIIFKYLYGLKYQLVIFITNVTFVLTVKIYFKLLYIPFHPNIFCLKSISCLISVLPNAVSSIYNHATIKWKKNVEIKIYKLAMNITHIKIKSFH